MRFLSLYFGFLILVALCAMLFAGQKAHAGAILVDYPDVISCTESGDTYFYFLTVEGSSGLFYAGAGGGVGLVLFDGSGDVLMNTTPCGGLVAFDEFDPHDFAGTDDTGGGGGGGFDFLFHAFIIFLISFWFGYRLFAGKNA